MFFRQIVGASGLSTDNRTLDALWELVWAGLVTNDTLAPVRATEGVGRMRPPSARAAG